MKPRCSWRELILIQPIKVSNNKSFLQRETCAEVWGSTAGLVELLFVISAGAGGDFFFSRFGAPALAGTGLLSAASRVRKLEIKPEMRSKREKANRRTSD